jgi:hypothetical protein
MTPEPRPPLTRLLNIIVLLVLVGAASFRAHAGEMDWAIYFLLIGIAGFLVQVANVLITINHRFEHQAKNDSR